MLTKDEVMRLAGLELDAAVLVEFHGWKWMQKFGSRDNESKCALIPPKTGEWNRVNWCDLDWLACDFWPAENQRFTDWHSQGMLRVGGQMILGMMRPTTDANVIQGVQAEIERRNITALYLFALGDLLEIEGTPQLRPAIKMLWGREAVWAIMTAPLETKCRAALLCVMEKEADNGQ